MKKTIKLSIISTLAYSLVNASTTFAQDETWGAAAAPTGVATNIRDVMKDLTDWVLGFIAIIATLVIIYGGILYMTAGGNDDAVGKAKKTISYGIIGMVVACLLYTSDAADDLLCVDL